MDCSVHDIDLARWLLGNPRATRVFASGTIALHEGLRRFADMDNGLAIVEFDGRQRAVFYASRTCRTAMKPPRRSLARAAPCKSEWVRTLAVCSTAMHAVCATARCPTFMRASARPSGWRCRLLSQPVAANNRPL